LVATGIKYHTRNALAFVFQSQGDAEHRIPMREVRGSVQWVDIPVKIAAGFPAAAFFAEKIMVRPQFADALDDQLFRAAIRLRDQVDITFVLDGNFAEEGKQQRAGLASQFLHRGEIVLLSAHQRPRRPLSSAIYMISCLKMNRLGAPSRVSRTIATS